MAYTARCLLATVAFVSTKADPVAVPISFPVPLPEPVLLCTADAKLCEDGSWVSRDPLNNCEFRPCPDFCDGFKVGDLCCQLSDECLSRSDWIIDDWMQCGNKRYRNKCTAKCDGYKFEISPKCTPCDRDPDYKLERVSCRQQDCSKSSSDGLCGECTKYERCSVQTDNKCAWGLYSRSDHRYMRCLSICRGNKKDGMPMNQAGHSGKQGSGQYPRDDGKDGGFGSSGKPQLGDKGKSNGIPFKDGAYPEQAGKFGGEGGKFGPNMRSGSKMDQYPANKGEGGGDYPDKQKYDQQMPPKFGAPAMSGKDDQYPSNKGEGGEYPDKQKYGQQMPPKFGTPSMSGKDGHYQYEQGKDGEYSGKGRYDQMGGGQRGDGSKSDEYDGEQQRHRFPAKSEGYK